MFGWNCNGFVKLGSRIALEYSILAISHVNYAGKSSRDIHFLPLRQIFHVVERGLLELSPAGKLSNDSSPKPYSTHLHCMALDSLGDSAVFCK